jgi:carbon-monoxide dehydrogenase large subunit
VIGERVTRREDTRLLTGQGSFVDDLDLGEPLHVAFVRSPHPHARLVSIDGSPALAVPGVVGVYAAADLGSVNRPWPAYLPHPDLRPIPLTALPADKVRYVGQAVAVVVASSRYVAEDARDRVAVEYDVLPGIGSCDAALAASGEPVHDAAPDNVAAHVVQRAGSPDEALASAPHRLQETFRITRGGGHSMEGRGVAARWDPALGSFTVWDATQVPFRVRELLAHCFELSEDTFRVVAPPDVGGGFGPKAGPYPEDVLVPWVAREVGRPVKWIEDRFEHFVASHQEREQVHSVDVGFDESGRVLALSDRFLHDSGAYASNLIVPLIAGTTVPGPYRIPNLHIEFTALFTNIVPVGAVRGAGRPQGVAVMERVMDGIAARLGLDVAEVRFRNFVQPHEFPYDVGLTFRDGSPLRYDSGDYPELLRRVLSALGYPERRAEQSRLRRAGVWRGIGVSVAVEGVGFGPFEGATARLDSRGRVLVILGAPPQGQGHETTFAQIGASAVGVGMDLVDVVTGDTQRIPFGVGTFASRVVANAGPALLRAGTELRSKILRVAGVVLEADPADLEISGPEVVVRGTSRGVALAQVARIANAGPPGVNLPAGVEAGLEATSYFSPERAGYSGSAQACVVDVDVETGAVSIVAYVVGHDCGTLINPLLVEGQIFGGVAHGLGNALYEHPVFAPDGQPLTTSYLDYALPSSLEVPRMATVHLETPSPLNPLGVKGAGEAGTLGVPAVVASAVEDALRPLGVRILELPLTPARVAELAWSAGADGAAWAPVR